jgi:hypothetical protein
MNDRLHPIMVEALKSFVPNLAFTDPLTFRVKQSIDRARTGLTTLEVEELLTLVLTDRATLDPAVRELLEVAKDEMMNLVEAEKDMELWARDDMENRRAGATDATFDAQSMKTLRGEA